MPAALRRRAAFTLIEMLAVVAIFALLAAFVAPNLGLVSSRRLQQQAQRLTAQLELARQRTVVTGIPHRLAIDLDRGSYWLEWFVTQAEALGEVETPAALDLRGSAQIPMSPPPTAAREFRPLPGMFGRETAIEESLRFTSVETLGGSVGEGEAFVVFERDGTASPTEIILADEDDHALALEVQPLAESVLIHDVEK
ncbi:MAG TPA: prepilin-type N-terminal cleavage/methylation domain-containing protein [Myxococcota bacterium]